jgi:hypothetical protein
MFVDFIDAVHGNTWSVELSEKDTIFVNDTWYRQDELLVDLSDTSELFAGKTAWADLELIHYQLLLFRAFDYLRPKHTEDEMTVRFKEPFATFRFLAAALVKFHYLNGVTGFDTLVISRPKEAQVVIDFRLTTRFDWNEYTPPKPPAKPIFHVVVDNTKSRNV